MPGICGIIQLKGKRSLEADLDIMVNTMRHEAHYTHGTWADPDLTVGIGWTAHGGGFADCNPIWNENRDILLAFAGEHYWSPSEVQKLRAAGHDFKPDNASGLVHLYEERGPEFLTLLNGTFSGLLYDRRQGEVMVFNDRFGLNRVYVHESADALYFSTEAKALLRLRPELRRINRQSLGELVICNCTLQDRTLFDGVSLMPPASRWAWRSGQAIRKESYFDRDSWRNQEVLAPSEYYEELRATFNRVLPNYFAGPQEVGLSLTGGLDSRMIIAGMAGRLPDLRCYTFGGTYRDSEDVKLSREVAALCGRPHEVITVDDRFCPHFLDLARRCVYISDGAMDVSGSVGLYVNRMARAIAPVRMTGNYGSEILRGNVVLKASRSTPTGYAADFQPELDRARETFRSERQGTDPLTFIAYKQVPWHHFARFSEEQSQLMIRAPYLDNELVALAYRAPLGLLLNKQLAYRYTVEEEPALAGAPTDRGMLQRPRFLPTKVFELSKELLPKAEYYFDYGMPQWLARTDQIFSALHLERLFLGQQKYYHFRIWYRRALAAQVREVLLDARSLSRDYLDRQKVESMIQAHTAGKGNFTLEIHRLLTCEFIYRELLES